VVEDFVPPFDIAALQDLLIHCFGFTRDRSGFFLYLCCSHRELSEEPHNFPKSKSSIISIAFTQQNLTA
jgi:hypothetical protein